MHDITGMVPDITQLANESAIRDILALHCRGVDRAEEAALKACYWPDAEVVYGPKPAPAHDFCTGLASAIKAYAQTHHVISNILIDFPDGPNGKVATVETYLTAYHYLQSAENGDSEMTYLGRYLDRFEKRDEHWKIIHRLPIMSWTQNAAVSHNSDHPALASLAKADRFPVDPIY